MQIQLNNFNLDEAINAHWLSSQTKLESIVQGRQESERVAINALTRQFQLELDTYLEGSLQQSLNITIVTPKIISALGVFASFHYLDIEFILKRNEQQWELSYNGRTVTSEPDTLQKTLLFELGKLKNERTS